MATGEDIKTYPNVIKENKTYDKKSNFGLLRESASRPAKYAVTPPAIAIIPRARPNSDDPPF